MEKCNFLKILQCPDFENLWGDSWHLFQPKKLDESDGGFCFLRIIFSSHVWTMDMEDTTDTVDMYPHSTGTPSQLVLHSNGSSQIFLVSKALNRYYIGTGCTYSLGSVLKSSFHTFFAQDPDQYV